MADLSSYNASSTTPASSSDPRTFPDRWTDLVNERRAEKPLDTNLSTAIDAKPCMACRLQPAIVECGDCFELLCGMCLARGYHPVEHELHQIFGRKSADHKRIEVNPRQDKHVGHSRGMDVRPPAKEPQFIYPRLAGSHNVEEGLEYVGACITCHYRPLTEEEYDGGETNSQLANFPVHVMVLSEHADHKKCSLIDGAADVRRLCARLASNGPELVKQINETLTKCQDAGVSLYSRHSNTLQIRTQCCVQVFWQSDTESAKNALLEYDKLSHEFLAEQKRAMGIAFDTFFDQLVDQCMSVITPQNDTIESFIQMALHPIAELLRCHSKPH